MRSGDIWIKGLTVLSMTAALCVQANPPSEDWLAIWQQAQTRFSPFPSQAPNAQQDSAERIALGRRLFFETRLSKHNNVSCNSCHRLDGSGAGVDHLAVSVGSTGQLGTRNAPTVLNVGFESKLFWDGRSPSLTDQAKGPLLNPVEMAMPDEASIEARLQADPTYSAQFAQAFADEKPHLSFANLLEAIAAFERSLVSRAAFDDYLAGDLQAMSQDAQRGLDLFMRYECTECHSGSRFGGGYMDKLGIKHPYPDQSDLGLFLVTGNERDKMKFKVPSLRNSAITWPYFHNGKVATLEEAVRLMAYHQKDRTLSTQEIQWIVAFLEALTDQDKTALITKRPRDQAGL